jgi:hypothetical protein
MDGRYIVMQALNMWTDDFAEIGTRTNGGKAGNYLIAGPKLNRATPKDVDVSYKCTRRYAWVLVQMAASSAADFPAIHAKQDQLKITPLSAWGKPYTPPAKVAVDPNVDLTATPFDQVRLMTGATFFARLAKILQDNPPYLADAKMTEKLKKLGVESGKPFNPSKLEPAVLEGINKAPAEVWKQLAVGPHTMKNVNGWINMLNLGKYGTDYNTRAFIAFAGLGALQKEDAVYPSAFVDGSGVALDGGSKCIMHFEKDGLPPSFVNVWSISQYRENFYVHNSLERYQIGAGMPLKYNPDGSLDVYIQANSPSQDKESNWLPLPPSGMVNLTIRIYNPKPETFDPTYKFPPVKRVA